MANPVELEREFDELQNRLALASSVLVQLLLIYDFLAGYKENPSLYESYIRQLSQQVPIVDHPLKIVGTDPGWLEHIYHAFNDLAKDYPIIREVESFRKALGGLKGNICFLYACLGEFDKATSVLTGGRRRLTESITNVSDWIESLSVNYPDLSENISLVQNIVDQSAEHREHTAYVPVIEKKAGNRSQNEFERPRLRRLQVSIERTTKDHDDIHLNVATINQDHDSSPYLSKPLDAVRSLINEAKPGLRSHHYHGRVFFRLMYSPHEGSSASLAMAGLLYGAMSEASEERIIYNIRDRVAITGDISENGKVIPVDNRTLSMKVQACFYSWVDVMVVPQTQLPIAMKENAKLQQQYPNRKLVILGVDDLSGLFFDRRISEEIRIGHIRQAGRILWKRKVEITTLFVLLLMAGIIVALIEKPIDRNPVIVQYLGNEMIIKNKEGQALWKMSGWDHAAGWQGSHSPLKLTVFYDVNGDGINDMINSKQSYANKNGEYNSLVCYDGVTHKVLWRLKEKAKLHYPYKSFIGNDSYISNGMLLDTMSAGPASLYMIEIHRKYFPGILLRIDPKTGKVEDTFVNAGHLNAMGLADVNHNGKYEVVVTGVNNAYDQAFVAVLPHSHFHTQSPTTKIYKLQHYPLQPDIGYIRIPMTYLGKALSNLVTFNVGVKIEFHEKGLWLRVNDTRPAIDNLLMRNAQVLYQFNKTMHIADIGTNDAYDLLARQQIVKGKLKHTPPSDYFVHFKDSLLYWNGKGWQHKAYLPFWGGG